MSQATLFRTASAQAARRLCGRQGHGKTPAPGALRARVAPLAGLTALIVLLLGGPAAQAQVSDPLLEKRVTALEPLDRQYMDRQRQRIDELTLRHYGGRCCRSEFDLDYLQRLLDDRHVRAEHTLELQGMGVLMGDLLAAQLDLNWVVYEDAKGRSRALQLAQTDNFLFPVTMISRRREAGDTTSIAAIYRGAVAAMQAARPPLPFEAPR